MERDKHIARIENLLQNEQPDVVCLQEAPEEFASNLKALGYYSNFAPTHIYNEKKFGVTLAHTKPFTCKTTYYHQANEPVGHRDGREQICSVSNPYLIAHLVIDGKSYTVATTHAPVTKDGLEDDHQREIIDNLLHYLDKEPPHIILGDFNIPRGYNQLYSKLMDHYQDAIPSSYPSSLDRNLHRHGNNKNLDQPIFDAYMVDYLFTKEPYVANEVRLEFGVSDHAAVVANIGKIYNQR